VPFKAWGTAKKPGRRRIEAVRVVNSHRRPSVAVAAVATALPWAAVPVVGGAAVPVPAVVAAVVVAAASVIGRILERGFTNGDPGANVIMTHPGSMEVRTMILLTGPTAVNSVFRFGVAALMVVSLTLSAFNNDVCAAEKAKKGVQETFASPDEAAKALAAAAAANDVTRMLAILGKEGAPLITSGDDVADREGREKFVRLYEEKNSVVREGDSKAILEVGHDAWPLPIPMVKEEEGWRFDTRQGAEEIIDRRIGKNELSAIQVCLAYVDTQREYAARDRDSDGLLEYAQKFVSEPGKKDGLYWESKEGEETSPLGPFAAQARKEGYTRKKAGNQPSPYHGYFYKILTAQGKNAPGGAYSYVVKGKMIGGFALAAYPASYGTSGIMTFIVNHDGVVYEKDLGKETEAVVKTMTSFDPDQTWRKIEGKELEVPAPGSGT
jgi:hypothetical protein